MDREASKGNLEKTRGRPGPSRKPVPATELWEAYQETGSAREAGARFGISTATAGCRLKEAGYRLEKVGPRSRPVPIEELWDAYLETGSAGRAGARFGISGSIAERRLKAAGYTLFGRGGVTPKPGSADELEDAYQETGSLEKAGALFDLHYTTVRNRLIAAGHDVFPGQRRFSKDELDLIASHFEAGRDGQDGDDKDTLARLLGRSVGAIDRQAQKMGLTNQKAPRLRQRKWLASGPNSYTTDQLIALLDRLERSGLSIAAFCGQEGISSTPFIAVMRSRLPGEYRKLLEKRGLSGEAGYDRGRGFEQRIANELHQLFSASLNSLTINLAPGSRGPADIVVELGPYRYLIQAKLSAQNFVPREWNALIDAAVSPPSLPIFATPVDSLTHFWLLIEKRDGARRRRSHSWIEVAPTAKGIFLPTEAADRDRFLDATKSWRDSLPEWKHLP